MGDPGGDGRGRGGVQEGERGSADKIAKDQNDSRDKSAKILPDPGGERGIRALEFLANMPSLELLSSTGL